MEQSKLVRVLVAQGYCLLSETLIERLDREDGIDVCATASDMDGIREKIEQYKPHVLVMNISMKCSAGIPSLKKLKQDYFWLGIVALSCDSEFENAYIGQALRSGADSYISADDSLENLVQAIRTVGSGKPFISDTTKKLQRDHVVQENLLLQLAESLGAWGYSPQNPFFLL